MARAWDSDDRYFVLVLLAAVISQTAMSKNVVGTTASSVAAFFSRTMSEPSRVQPRTPVQAIRRSNPVWAGTVAFFKGIATKVARREMARPVAARTTSTLSFLHRSWHASPQQPRTAAPKSWRIGLDRLHLPWKKRTRTSTLAQPTDPRVAASLQSPRI